MLSQAEIDCVDQTLRAQQLSLTGVIQRGVAPSNAFVAKIREACARGRPPGAAAAARPGSQALASIENRTEEAARKIAIDKAAAEKAAAEKAAAEKAAAEKERVAAEKAAAATAGAEKAAAEKAAVEKAAAEKEAAEKATAEKAAAEKALAEKAATEKPAAVKVAVEKAASEKAKSENAAAAKKVTADLSAVEKALAEEAAIDTIKPSPGRANAEPTRMQPLPEAARTQQEAAIKLPAEAASAYAAAESRISFFYGLISGPVIFCFGGVVFLLLGRNRNARVAQPEAVASGPAQGPDLERLIEAVIVEQRRRERFAQHPGAVPREQRVEEAGLR